MGGFAAQVGAAMKHHGANMQLVRDFDGFARVTQLLQWAALTFADHERPDGPQPRPDGAGKEAVAAARPALDAHGPHAAHGLHVELRQLQVRCPLAAARACYALHPGAVCSKRSPSHLSAVVMMTPCAATDLQA